MDIKCKARLHTNLNNYVLKELNFHVCDTDAAGIEVQKIVTGIKRRANVTMEGQMDHVYVDGSFAVHRPCFIKFFVCWQGFNFFKFPLSLDAGNGCFPSCMDCV